MSATPSKRKRAPPSSPAPSPSPVKRTAAPSVSAGNLTLTASTTLRIPQTPSKRILRTASVTDTGSPSPRKNAAVATPKRDVRFADNTISPAHVVTNADRSARRKSVRRLVSHDMGDEEDSEVDDINLARRIYSGSEESESEEEETAQDASATPSKRKPRKRKEKETTPPPPVFNGVDSYFHQNRKVRQQTSTATLAKLPALNHSTYFSLLRKNPESHVEERAALLESYEKDYFGQFLFELDEGFNLLLFGYGSKRKLLMRLAQRLYTGPGSVVVVNGYLPTLTARDILATISTALLGPDHALTATVENVLGLLDTPEVGEMTLVVHNIDGESLRNEKTQTLLSRLAAHEKISMIASVDHIRAPLLWDAARLSQFNFLWHDATTFEPYSVEIPADEALSLVDGAGRAGGTRGVKYVLASLPSNAKALFRVLVSHQLEAMLAGEGGKGGGGRGAPGEDVGVEYRVLYQRALGEFICSNDVAFRTLLKEFQDHQMITSKKDSAGTEIFWAPFRREDLEGILDDIDTA